MTGTAPNPLLESVMNRVHVRHLLGVMPKLLKCPCSNSKTTLEFDFYQKTSRVSPEVGSKPKIYTCKENTIKSPNHSANTIYKPHQLTKVSMSIKTPYNA